MKIQFEDCLLNYMMNFFFYFSLPMTLQGVWIEQQTLKLFCKMMMRRVNLIAVILGVIAIKPTFMFFYKAPFVNWVQNLQNLSTVRWRALATFPVSFIKLSSASPTPRCFKNAFSAFDWIQRLFFWILRFMSLPLLSRSLSLSLSALIIFFLSLRCWNWVKNVILFNMLFL